MHLQIWMRTYVHSSHWTSCSLLLNLSFTLRDCLFSWTLFALGTSCIQYARRNLTYLQEKQVERSLAVRLARMLIS